MMGNSTLLFIGADFMMDKDASKAPLRRKTLPNLFSVQNKAKHNKYIKSKEMQNDKLTCNMPGCNSGNLKQWPSKLGISSRIPYRVHHRVTQMI